MTEDKPKQQRSSRYLKWMIALLVIILFVTGVRLTLKSDWLLDYARDWIVEEANNQLEGELNIGEIRGDLLFGITLTDISLADKQQNEILAVDSLHLRYTPLSLGMSPHRLDLLRATGVRGEFVQGEDSMWNAQRIMPPATEEQEEGEPLYWKVDRIILDAANISVRSDHLLPDGFLEIENLSMEAAAERLSYRWYASLESFNMRLREGRLPSPVNISVEAQAEDGHISLESLVIQTGRTLLRSQAEVINQSQAAAQVNMSPLSSEDIEAYLDEYPLQKDLDLSLSLYGSFEDFGISLSGDAGTGGKLSASATTDLTDPFILNSLELELDSLNGPELLGDTTLPLINYAHMEGSGAINFADIENAQWEGSLLLEGLSMKQYELSSADFSYNLDAGTAALNGNLQQENEQILIDTEASSIFSDQPKWRVSINTENLNLANWLQDPEMESRLAVDAEMEGSGMNQSTIRSQFNFMANGSFGDQHFSEAALHSSITPSQLTVDILGVIEESRFKAGFDVQDWGENPSYQFVLAFDEVNLEEFSGLEDLPTYLNGQLEGEGRSFNIEELELSAVVWLNSSNVNGEQIDTLRADLAISDQYLYVEDVLLESSIADADVSLRQHLIEFNDPQNRLEFYMQLKNLYPLAPLLGAEEISAEGEVEGQLERNNDRILEFTGNVDVVNVRYDSLFTSERIVGQTTATLFDEPHIETEFELTRPIIMEQDMQDLRLNGSAQIGEEKTVGQIAFELRNGGESRLAHSGNFSFSEEEILLTTNHIEFETPFRMLTLRNPFDITYAGEVLSIDSMRVQSADEDSYLELWAPHVDSLRQSGGLNAQQLNLGVLLRTFVETDVLEAFLSAQIQFNNTPDSLYLSSRGWLTEIEFENGTMDSLLFSGNIDQEWLDLELQGWNESSPLFNGMARIPFLPGDPGTFDDHFFDREIEGEFVLNDSDVNYWLSFLPDEIAEETNGMISFEGSMGGQAGEPEFTGNLQFHNGNLSGVRVDSLNINALYQHDREHMELTGGVISRRARVLDFDAQIPFQLDLKNNELMLPSEEDSVQFNMETRNFNLAIVNDFVGRDMFRQVEGRLNGDINITGTLASLKPSGRLELSNGAMRVVTAGININNIRSQLNFSEDQIELQQFSMDSGPGRIRAEGTVEIENLTPGQISIAIRGEQFRAANTSEYNAIIDLSTDISGTYEEPTLTGSLSFLSGFVTLQNFGESSVEDVELEDEEEQDPVDFYKSLEMEMDVNFRRQFFIRNRQFLDLEIELGGQIDLVKSPGQELELFGQLEGVRGYARPLGKNFQIEEAFVTFSGQVDNPELDVRTVYEPPQARAEVRIYYVIEGNAQDPDFRFESEPEMELQDIISYTVFGRPFYELESWEQVVAGDGGGPSATDVALDVLLDRFETLASQRLGIDVVQIDNTRSSSDSNTSILTGWYLNRRTFFAIINEVSTTPKTLFLLEYMLRENLELIVTQGDDSHQGIDLRWHYDY